MGLLSALFGGSSSKSSNTNNKLLTQSLTPALGYATQGGNALSSILFGGDASGFNKFKQNAGFDFAARQGTQGVMGNAAARGLLNSGSAGKAYVRYGEGLNQQYLDKYLERLMGFSDLGLKAGSVLSDAGKTSSSSENTGNLGKFIGSVAPKILPFLSDRRTKQNIEKIGQLDNGLNVYEYEYIHDKNKTRYVGVMADEVKKIQPEALGPKYHGFDTVDYSKIEGWPD